ncbi:hypothetical protein LguiA_018838 [Lonicera macranthoides]
MVFCLVSRKTHSIFSRESKDLAGLMLNHVVFKKTHWWSEANFNSNGVPKMKENRTGLMEKERFFYLVSRKTNYIFSREGDGKLKILESTDLRKKNINGRRLISAQMEFPELTSKWVARKNTYKSKF